MIYAIEYYRYKEEKKLVAFVDDNKYELACQLVAKKNQLLRDQNVRNLNAPFYEISAINNVEFNSFLFLKE